MLNLVHGDILSRNTDETKSIVVCHQVNCMGVMGAGLAKQVRNKFPEAYAAYLITCSQIKRGMISGLGKVQFYDALSDAGYILANIFGQYGYGRNKRYTDYDAVRKALQTIARAYQDATIRIPYKMGCGLGGGDWGMVLPIIQEELVDNRITVELWTLS